MTGSFKGWILNIALLNRFHTKIILQIEKNHYIAEYRFTNIRMLHQKYFQLIVKFSNLLEKPLLDMAPISYHCTQFQDGHVFSNKMSYKCSGYQSNRVCPGWDVNKNLQSKLEFHQLSQEPKSRGQKAASRLNSRLMAWCFHNILLHIWKNKK